MSKLLTDTGMIIQNNPLEVERLQSVIDVMFGLLLSARRCEIKGSEKDVAAGADELLRAAGIDTELANCGRALLKRQSLGNLLTSSSANSFADAVGDRRFAVMDCERAVGGSYMEQELSAAERLCACSVCADERLLDAARDVDDVREYIGATGMDFSEVEKRALAYASEGGKSLADCIAKFDNRVFVEPVAERHV